MAFARIWGLRLWADVERMVEGCGNYVGRIVEGGWTDVVGF